MIITKSGPFTKKDLKRLQESFDSYIKTVIDIEKKVCSAGCNRHFESEKILLEQGSKQSNLWGGGLDNDNNMSNEIQDTKIREEFSVLMKYFFESIL